MTVPFEKAERIDPERTWIKKEEIGNDWRD